MAITPNTNLRLLKCPIEIDNKNQIKFTSKQAQYNYFNSLPSLNLDDEDISYQRKDSIIAFPEHIDNLWEYNYCMYQNENYTDKWFYCFITDMKYENDGLTYITIKTDVFQTWQFDLTFMKSFVEREHVNDDTIGLHTIPENLQLGEYIEQLVNSSDKIEWNSLLTNIVVVLGVSEVGVGVTTYPSGNKQYNGVFSGLTYITFPTFSDCASYIRALQSSETEDLIYTAFLAPLSLVNDAFENKFTPEGYNFEMAFVPYSALAKDIAQCHVSDDFKLDKNYTPVNNKLLSYPYRYFLLSNNVGNFAEYHYELFKHDNNNKMLFYIMGAINNGCSIKAFPESYNKAIPTGESYSETDIMYSLDAPKLPTCSWINDPYTNWLTQNAVNIPLDIIKNVGQIAVGTGLAIGTAGTGAIAGGGLILSGSMGIANTMSEIYEHSLAPETVKGGANQGDLIFGLRKMFTPVKFSIKEEYAKNIDNYFSMFGYKVNETKIPNLTGRRNWNYVKTIDINIEANIPQADLTEIKEEFNSGITIWHNTNTFLDYSQNNDII